MPKFIVRVQAEAKFSREEVLICEADTEADARARVQSVVSNESYTTGDPMCAILILQERNDMDYEDSAFRSIDAIEPATVAALTKLLDEAEEIAEEHDTDTDQVDLISDYLDEMEATVPPSQTI